MQRGAAVVCSQRTDPKGIKPAGGACKGIFSQEDVDSPGPNRGELVRNDAVISGSPICRLVQGTEPSWLGSPWGRSSGAPAVGAQAGWMCSWLCVYLLQFPVLEQENTGFQIRACFQSSFSAPHRGEQKLVICFLVLIPKCV